MEALSRHRVKDPETHQFVSDKLSKALRDRRAILKYAHTIIILSEDAPPQIIHNQHFQLNTIAVLAPDWIDGHALPESLVLEIGMGRLAPYGRTEQVRGKKLCIHPRQKTRSLTAEEIKDLWPILERVFCQITATARGNWSTRDAFWVIHRYGCHPMERGSRFRIEQDEELLCQIIRKTELDTREHLRNNASAIRHWLRGYQYNYYPEKQLRSFARMQKAVDLWKNMRDDKEHQRFVLKRLGNKKLLFIEALRVYGLPDPNDSVSDEEQRRLDLNLTIRKLGINTPPRSCFLVYKSGGGTHAIRCLTFEHFFERKHRALNNL